jgi:hypothetical protein
MWAARSYCEHFALDMADTDPVLLGPADQAELAQWVDVAYVHLAEVELHRAGWIDSAAVDRPFMMEDISPKAVLEAPDGERPAGVTATARALYEDLLGFDGDLDEQPARRYKASAVFTHEPRAGFCARHRH